VSSDTQPLLASGKAPWWKISRPRLAAPDSLTDDSVVLTAPAESETLGAAPRGARATGAGSAAGSGVTTRPKTAAVTNSLGTIFGLGAAAVGVVFALWLIIAVTIAPTPSIDGDRYVVKWAAWPQGQAPVGATAVIHDAPIDSGLSSRLGYVFNGQGLSVVEITGDIRAATARDPELTSDHYIVECISGDCATGENSLVPVTHVMGELVGRYQPPFTITDRPTSTGGSE